MIVDIAVGSISGVITALATLFIVWQQLKANKGTSLFSTTRDSFLHAQRIIYTKRIEAAEVLWENVLNIRYDLPLIINFINVLTSDEHVTMNKESYYKKYMNWDLKDIMDNQIKHFESVERMKIYLDIKLWTDFNIYYTIMIRVVYLLSEGKNDPTKNKWYEDKNIRNLIKNVLSQKFLHEIDQKNVQKMSSLQFELEWKILSSLKKFISVTQLEKESLERAKELDNEITKMQREKQRMEQ